ncbi:FAD-dependent monooxygenase [Streptomyces sp. NPDC086182]|uniref:FAD-dependent monooxygenase n=1 Tax=Streptomyces sp. NPDC086182 TaxID=3155058 RepID=UPI00343AD892
MLLAGDSAHVHSPNGGQGLALGLLDATNLGWKLAATVLGRAPDGLLDSYTAERHPAAAAVLHNTRAQSALLRPGPHTDALRDIVSDLMDIEEVNQYFGRMLSGLGIRYALPYTEAGAHRLTGAYCPDLRLTTETSGEAPATSLAQLAEQGRPVLIHTRDYPEVPAATAVRHGVLSVAAADTLDRDDLCAVLVRPDGVIAWAVAPGRPADTTGLEHALRAWFAPA